MIENLQESVIELSSDIGETGQVFQGVGFPTAYIFVARPHST